MITICAPYTLHTALRISHMRTSHLTLDTWHLTLADDT